MPGLVKLSTFQNTKLIEYTLFPKLQENIKIPVVLFIIRKEN